ncbi:glutaredoxin 3 [Suttonella sp. R2A3]|uniref:glutaredoxin 3 n=1 Tax=Suttonella sp. R2A3 TaxID=2908648 RepID=UPI001F47B5A7|nr:glutaredoxin 3 [Suttonella sp. R2A3]UJF24365.1 glutaredoxin 3 [Suttonella sp. R2A3]
MKPVTMYIKPTCPYCQNAHFLLEDKGVHYTAINLLQQPERRDEMIERSNGRTTVPQVFIGDTHVGGFDELEALNDSGELDQLLAE